jgi:anti-sigma factor RsiW
MLIMEITRSVVLDLLPLYLAGEVSDETHSIVDRFLESDPELAAIVSDAASLELREAVPAPLSQERQMETFSEVKRHLLNRTLIWATVIAFAVLSCLGLAALAYFFLVSS